MPAAEPPCKVPRLETTPSSLDCLDALLSSSSSSQSQCSPVRDEVERYLAMDVIGRRKPDGTYNCPLDWWRDNESRFPAVARVARRFLGAPPTSVPSERLFSAAGQIYTDRRSSLMPERAELLLFLKHNLPLISYFY